MMGKMKPEDMRACRQLPLFDSLQTSFSLPFKCQAADMMGKMKPEDMQRMQEMAASMGMGPGGPAGGMGGMGGARWWRGLASGMGVRGK